MEFPTEEKAEHSHGSRNPISAQHKNKKEKENLFLIPRHFIMKMLTF